LLDLCYGLVCGQKASQTASRASTRSVCRASSSILTTLGSAVQYVALTTTTHTPTHLSLSLLTASWWSRTTTASDYQATRPRHVERSLSATAFLREYKRQLNIITNFSGNVYGF